MFIVDPCYLHLKGEPMLSTATPSTTMSVAPTKRANQFLHISVSTWVTIALMGSGFLPLMCLSYMYSQSQRATQSWLI